MIFFRVGLGCRDVLGLAQGFRDFLVLGLA